MLCLFLLVGLKTFAQIIFKKGYFIDKNNQRVECLIKNESWDVNNGSFEYKLVENQDAIIKEFESVEEISIYNIVKYKRFTVDIDVNVTNDIKNLSVNRKVDLTSVSLLLKILIEGDDNSLFKHKASNFTYFFYLNKNVSTPKQLIHKKYLVNNKSATIREYNPYKQVLAKEFSCDNRSIRNLERLNYNETALKRFFTKYITCSNENYTILDEFKQTKRLFFKIKAGVSSANIIVDKPAFDVFDFSYQIDFGSKIIPVFGIEIEYFLPTKGNKWSLYTDPKIRTYRAEKNVITSRNGNPENVEIAYRSVEIPFNIRYYMYLNSDSKLSINLGGMIESDLNSNIEFEAVRGPVFDDFKKIDTRLTPVFGIGYHLDKYNIELKYSDRNIFNESPIFTTGYSNIELAFSYTMF